MDICALTSNTNVFLLYIYILSIEEISLKKTWDHYVLYTGSFGISVDSSWSYTWETSFFTHVQEFQFCWDNQGNFQPLFSFLYPFSFWHLNFKSILSLTSASFYGKLFIYLPFPLVSEVGVISYSFFQHPLTSCAINGINKYLLD